MRSIRLSLMAYFLVLLALSLGAMACFVYGLTRQTLLAKEESTRDLLQARYEKRRQDFRDKFDEEILHRAQTLAGLAQAQVSFTGPGLHLGTSAAGAALSSTLSTHAFASRAMPALQAHVQWSNLQVWMARYPFQLWFPDIKFTEDIMPKDREGQLREYFQISSPSGMALQRSSSLGDRTFGVDRAVRERLARFDWEFDEVELEAGKRVRRVTLNAPVTRYSFPPLPVRPSPPRATRPPRAIPEPPRRPFERSAPAIFIQCARNTDKRDEGLAAIDRELALDIDRLEAESDEAIASIRRNMLILGLAAFAAAIIGGIWLVNRGLAPVQRLAKAVSQVSEKDFQLRLAERDVPTELAPIVEKLKRSLGSLEGAFRREKQAAADISHELRTPIASLLATVQVCLKRDRSSEEYRTTLQTCCEIGEQLNVLVERLLALARLDAGADTLRPISVDVPEIAEQCVSLVRPLAEARGLSLRFERNGPATLKTDPEKLREVLTNLLHNAVQYNRPRGSVELVVDRRNDDVQLEVRDTGVGIPPESHEHLFERFYRVDPSRQSDTMHAGLGLAIVKGYLDLMGGRIEVESELGKGSIFRVLLPLKGKG